MKRPILLSIIIAAMSVQANASEKHNNWESSEENGEICVSLNDTKECLSKDDHYEAQRSLFQRSLHSNKVGHYHRNNSIYTISQYDFDLLILLQDKFNKEITQKFSLENSDEIVQSKNSQFTHNDNYHDSSSPVFYNSYVAIPSKNLVCMTSTNSQSDFHLNYECKSMLNGILNENAQLDIDPSDAWSLSKDPGLMTNYLKHNRYENIEKISFSTNRFDINCEDVDKNPGVFFNLLEIAVGRSQLTTPNKFSVCKLEIEADIQVKKDHIKKNFDLELFGNFQDKEFKKSAKKLFKRLLKNNIEQQLDNKLCENIKCMNN